MKHESFIAYATKRHYYSECLSDIINYLHKHSQSIKYFRLNNAKGYEKILKELLDNVDTFTEEGEDMEIVIPS